MLDQNDLQAIAQLISQSEDRMMEVMQQQADTLMGMMETKIQTSQREVMVFVENSVGKRIDSLFDGYKLTHEKQWELAHRMEPMEQRLSALEHKAG